MKKAFRYLICLMCCLLCLCVILLIASCEDEFFYPYEEMKEQVESIEIVKITYIDSMNTKRDIIKTLNEELDRFLKELSEIKLLYPVGDVPEPYNYPQDYVFMIYYIDDTYEMLGRNATKFYDNEGASNGGFHRAFPDNSFDELLEKFIEIDID